MKQIQTRGIVLARTDYGEADRILTIITPDQGKLRLMAKGVRKERSKLAGGIELFSISELSFIPGKRDIGTLVSSRLQKHFSRIVGDIERTMIGYELLKRTNKVTEDAAEGEYFELLAGALTGLDVPELDSKLTEVWFDAGLLKLAGHSPNLTTDVAGQRLKAGSTYGFDTDNMVFVAAPRGRYKTDEIKLLRLLFTLPAPESLSKITDIHRPLRTCQQLISLMSATSLHS